MASSTSRGSSKTDLVLANQTGDVPDKMTTNQSTNCALCNAKYTDENKSITRNDVSFCTKCVECLPRLKTDLPVEEDEEEEREECDKCGEMVLSERIVADDGGVFCDLCYGSDA